MTQLERMNNGLIYDPMDEEIFSDQTKRLELLYDFNATRPCEGEKRVALLKKMFAEVGENCYIEPPLRANWAGKNVHLADFVYANFNLTLVDDDEIYVGAHTMIGPNVTITTAGHPVEPTLRAKGLQYNRGVHIGTNVWIGAGVMIMPGVTIGDNSVIGAGSVVTKDIPSDVVAVGSPCRILREISEHDHTYFYKNAKIDWDNL